MAWANGRKPLVELSVSENFGIAEREVRVFYSCHPDMNNKANADIIDKYRFFWAVAYC